MSLLVVALGGNALGNNPSEQKEIVKKTAKIMVDIISEGNQLIIVHGNGPQVGMINNSFELAHQVNNDIPLMPFPECGAMSQAYIGYHLQNAIVNELYLRKIKKNVVTIVSQVEVAANDEAFNNPTKPIGNFYSEVEAKALAKQYNFDVKPDANRGWRRVIASPKPIAIVEIGIIKNLIKDGTIVITAGGGGIPVVKDDNGYRGIDGVIDKDFASSFLAISIDANKLLILTAVDNVAINFGKLNQTNLHKLSLEEGEKYIVENQFAVGSMLPKVQAALDFVKVKAKNIAVIANLDKAKLAIAGKSGTIISIK